MPPSTHVVSVPGIGLTLTVLAVSSLTVMSNATIAPSLPGLAETFADTPAIEVLSGLVMSLPSLSVLLTAAFFGRWADRMDRRTLLIGLLAVYGVAGASGGLADSMTELLISRVVLGIAVAGTMTIATALAADYWTGIARTRFMGWQAAAMSGGGVMFLLCGGLLAEIDWRAPFLIYLMSYPVLLAVIAFLPKRTPPDRQVTKTSDQGASKLPRPILLRVGTLAAFAMMMFYLVPTRLPFLLVSNGITSPTAAGLGIACVNAAGLITALSFSRIRMYMEPQPIFAAGFALMALGYGMIALGDSYAVVLAGVFISGIGIGPTLPNQSSWLMSAVSENARGRAAGILTSAVFGGQLISPVLSGVMSTRMSQEAVFAVFAAVLFLVAILLMLDHRRRPSGDL